MTFESFQVQESGRNEYLEIGRLCGSFAKENNYFMENFGENYWEN